MCGSFFSSGCSVQLSWLEICHSPDTKLCTSPARTSTFIGLLVVVMVPANSNLAALMASRAGHVKSILSNSKGLGRWNVKSTVAISENPLNRTPASTPNTHLPSPPPSDGCFLISYDTSLAANEPTTPDYDHVVCSSPRARISSPWSYSQCIAVREAFNCGISSAQSTRKPYAIHLRR